MDIPEGADDMNKDTERMEKARCFPVIVSRYALSIGIKGQSYA